MVQLNNRRDVRILLVGEPGVGKTSLILSLVSEEFPEEVPPKAEEITIPADVTPERVPTHIVDYSELEQSEDILIEELSRAHVICVVYSADDADTLDQVTLRWMPLIRATLGPAHHTPVVLVGNKVDLIDDTNVEEVFPIMNQYAEIETCVECSARTLKNISEMFYYAQKAVLHPTAPLYNQEDKDLKDKCKAALTRIFKICDADNDGLLNDSELNDFQRQCFNAPLQPSALEEVKSVIKRNISDGVLDNSLTLKGFLYLHLLFVQRGRHETTWTVLRKFGYTDSLQLAKDYLYPPLKIPPGCNTELNHHGYEFLRKVFYKYDRDGDGALSPSELDDLFSTCPINPWGPRVHLAVSTDHNGFITMNGYLAQWTLTTALDIARTLEYLAYLGYPIDETHNQAHAVTVTRERRIDVEKKQTSRNVFQCHVIGPLGAGKTTFCQGILQRAIQEIRRIPVEHLPRHTISSINVYGQEKYLLLQDIDVHHTSDALLPVETQCDVACLVYDVSDPKSFQYVARVYLKYFSESRVPILMIGSKSDISAEQQDYALQPEEFCSKYKLPKPQMFSASPQCTSKDVYVKLATMAAYPSMRRLVHALLVRRDPAELLRHLRNIGLGEGRVIWLKAGLGIATIALIGALLVRLFHSRHLAPR